MNTPERHKYYKFGYKEFEGKVDYIMSLQSSSRSDTNWAIHASPSDCCFDCQILDLVWILTYLKSKEVNLKNEKTS